MRRAQSTFRLAEGLGIPGPQYVASRTRRGAAVKAPGPALCYIPRALFCHQPRNRRRSLPPPTSLAPKLGMHTPPLSASQPRQPGDDGAATSAEISCHPGNKEAKMAKISPFKEWAWAPSFQRFHVHHKKFGVAAFFFFRRMARDLNDERLDTSFTLHLSVPEHQFWLKILFLWHEFSPRMPFSGCCTLGRSQKFTVCLTIGGLSVRRYNGAKRTTPQSRSPDGSCVQNTEIPHKPVKKIIGGTSRVPSTILVHFHTEIVALNSDQF